MRHKDASRVCEFLPWQRRRGILNLSTVHFLSGTESLRVAARNAFPPGGRIPSQAEDRRNRLGRGERGFTRVTPCNRDTSSLSGQPAASPLGNRSGCASRSLTPAIPRPARRPQFVETSPGDALIRHCAPRWPPPSRCDGALHQHLFFDVYLKGTPSSVLTLPHVRRT